MQAAQAKELILLYPAIEVSQLKEGPPRCWLPPTLEEDCSPREFPLREIYHTIPHLIIDALGQSMYTQSNHPAACKDLSSCSHSSLCLYYTVEQQQHSTKPYRGLLVAIKLMY